ncbi:hypothetical protein GS396_09980 [Stenotrophomonas maltophilia]|nr:hypothetical protein GS396_09980 [Stenotrophomonas maltophilia]
MATAHSLANTLSVASFDYLDGYICLNGWEQRHEIAITDALSATGWATPHGRDIRAVLAHEITHFLDMTTTLWGLEFCHRKHVLHRSIKLGEPAGAVSDRLEVLLLSFSEIATHKALYTPRTEERLRRSLVYKHALAGHDVFGAIVRVFYFDGSHAVVDAPLSMLSVLEANAYAAEIIQRISDIELIVDEAERRVELACYEEEVKSSLCDANYIEYTLLIRITWAHFDWLDLKEVAHFVAALSRFSLDMPSLLFAMIVPVIDQSFKNREVGSVIAHDMRRSASRSVLLFKTMLFMYEWLNQLPDDQREERKAEIRSMPRHAIDKFWSEAYAEYREIAEWNEFDDLLARHPDSGGHHDEIVLRESAQFNRNLLLNFDSGIVPFDLLRLPDVLLGDNFAIKFKNRVELDIEECLDAGMGTLSIMSRLVRDSVPRKFY